MGNNQASSDNDIVHNVDPEFSISEKDLTYARTKTDTRLGDIDELKHSSQEIVLRKDIPIDDHLLTNENLKKLKTRVHLNHENLIRNYGFVLNHSNEGPSKLSLYFESWANDAAAEIRSRAKKQNFFDEEELHATLLTCIQVLEYLQSHRISHGHINPNAVLMSQEGDIKLLDHSLYEEEHSGYVACAQGANSFYIAPELLDSLKESKPEAAKDADPFKSDVFSLGMTFVYAALLEEPSDCYDWENYTFSTSKLFDHYERIRRRYQGPFVNILQFLLKVDAEDRPDFHSIMANLEYYQKHEHYIRDPKFNTQKFAVHESATKTSGISQRKDSLQNGSHTHTEEISHKKYSFVDPKVQEIIREAKEKNWIRKGLATGLTTNYSASETKYNQSFLDNDTKHSRALSGTAYRYANAFVDHRGTTTYDYASDRVSPLYSQHHYEYTSISKPVFESSSEMKNSRVKTVLENIDTKNLSTFDATKYSFNSPKVNKIIAEVRGADLSGYKQHEDINKLLSLATPTRTLFREVDESQRSPYAYSTEKNWYSSVSVTTSPQRKARDTSEIIKELREKYGTKHKLVEKETKEHHHSQEHITESRRQEQIDEQGTIEETLIQVGTQII